MAAKLKFSNAILCEHVVSGGSGKHTLINVYGGDILVREFPAKMMLGFYAEHTAEKSGDLWIKILRGKEEIAKLQVVVESNVKQSSGIIAMPVFEFVAEEETSIELVATMEGCARTPFLRKRILIAGGPNDPTIP